jgi:hypothetical protein
MANDAKHLALPLTHAVFVSLNKLNGYSDGSFNVPLLLLPSFALLPSFTS